MAPDDAEDDARRWGLELVDPDGPGIEDGIWEDHVPALEAFLAVATQWRVIAGGLGGSQVIGLDYTACEAGLRLAGVEMTPGLWAEVRVIESGAIAAMNGKDA